jgi:hypothetical protein
MAGEQGVDKAIAGLKAYLVANLPTYLSSYESDLSLDDGDLGRPVYLDAKREDDNREILQIYSEGTEEFEGDLKLKTHDCTVAWHFHTDADLDAGALKGRRIEVAMQNAIDADPTLGLAVTSAIVSGSDPFAPTDTENVTRRASVLAVRVVTYDG